MREQELWRRLDAHLGHPYSRMWASTVVLTDLDGRTVIEAMAAGIGHQRIWRAVWGMLELPESER